MAENSATDADNSATDALWWGSWIFIRFYLILFEILKYLFYYANMVHVLLALYSHALNFVRNGRMILELKP